MADDGADGQSAREQATALTRVLSGLKRRGCTLLLTGPAQHGAISAACRRLLGDGSGTRYRLFVLAGESAAHHRGVRSLTGTEAESATALSYETMTRGAAAAETATADATAGPTPGLEPRVPNRKVTGSLGELLAAVDESAAEFDRRADGLEPAELRICVDSLDALLAVHGEEAVFRFLHLLAAVVRRHGAMCHVHLPTDVDSKAVRLLEPTSDAVVEVRDVGGTQQRWHVPDAELTTDWLLL